MRWSERQLAMLRDMGIRVWAPALPDAAVEDGVATPVAERGADPAVLPAAAPAARAPAVAYRPDADRAAAPPASPAVARPGQTQALAPLAGADWLVIGEPFAATAADPDAVAEQELLLDNMLRAIRVARSAGGREGRACHLALEGGATDIDAALAAVQPRCILVLGRAPAAALLGIDEPLGKLRERVHERSGIPVVVTFALPYLLRHAADKPRAWADLCRAVAAIEPQGFFVGRVQSA